MARFANTETNGRTNFTLGHDYNHFCSTYEKDFNPQAIKNTRLLRFYEDLKFDEKPCRTRIEQFSFPETRSKKHPKVQKTYVTFGNDRCEKITAYSDFSQMRKFQPKAKPFPAPCEAEILPPCQQPSYMRSSLSNDFTFFGNSMNRKVYDSRVNDLNIMRDINNRDSVGLTLLGRRRKMLTRSMIDYKHPLERVKGNIKDFIMLQISPSVRQDSVWKSVNTGNEDNSFSENQGNFSWPDAEKGMKRFYRGQMHKTR